jgi:hypothetical protein
LPPHTTSIPHQKKARPVIVKRVSIETALRVPSPVNCAGALIVGLAVRVAFWPVPPTDVLALVKFAQVIRVLFAKWMTRDRFPKKEPMPGKVDG